MIKVDKLYRGIFWIKDMESLASVVIKAECNSNGFFTVVPDFELLAKSSAEFNHQAAWSKLSKRETENKPYNYYPRGRVEIRNGKAVLYANGNIADEKLLKWAINKFNLIKENGIEKVEIKADMSNHYLCYLDRER